MAIDAARSPGRLYAWLWFVGIFAALAYSGRFAGGVGEDAEPLYEWTTGSAGLVQFAIVTGIILLIAIHAPKRELFALRRPTSWWLALGIAVAIYIGMLVLSFAMAPFLDPAGEQGLVPETWPPPSTGAFALNAFRRHRDRTDRRGSPSAEGWDSRSCCATGHGSRSRARRRRSRSRTA